MPYGVLPGREEVKQGVIVLFRSPGVPLTVVPNTKKRRHAGPKTLHVLLTVEVKVLP